LEDGFFQREISSQLTGENRFHVEPGYFINYVNEVRRVWAKHNGGGLRSQLLSTLLALK
jgi:hypothetical protein